MEKMIVFDPSILSELATQREAESNQDTLTLVGNKANPDNFLGALINKNTYVEKCTPNT